VGCIASQSLSVCLALCAAEDTNGDAAEGHAAATAAPAGSLLARIAQNVKASAAEAAEGFRSLQVAAVAPSALPAVAPAAAEAATGAAAEKEATPSTPKRVKFSV
jgi:hypothetical protein